MHTILIIYCNITWNEETEWYEVIAVSDIKFWLQQLYSNKLKMDLKFGQTIDERFEAERKQLKIKSNAIIKISNNTNTHNAKEESKCANETNGIKCS